MEGVSLGLCRSIKRYWRRRRYDRLDGTAAAPLRRGRVQAARAGGGGRRRWRIRLPARIRIASPKAILVRLRDGYVRMMLRLSNSSAFAGIGGSAFGGQAIGYGRPFGAATLKEYDEKVIVEIYRSLVAQGQLGS